jgi:hypothetical protein
MTRRTARLVRAKSTPAIISGSARSAPVFGIVCPRTLVLFPPGFVAGADPVADGDGDALDGITVFSGAGNPPPLGLLDVAVGVGEVAADGVADGV